MQKIQIKKDWMKRACERAILTPDQQDHVADFLRARTKEHTFHVTLSDFPESIWRAVLDDARLPSNVRTSIALFVFGMLESDADLESIYKTTVDSPVEFGTSFQLLTPRLPNCEMHLNGRWYPVSFSVQFIEDDQKWTRLVRLNCSISLGERNFEVSHNVTRDMFVDYAGDTKQHSVIEILESFGLRRLQTSARDFNLRLLNSERLGSEYGKVVFVANSVIKPSEYSWWRGFEAQALGTIDMPSRCVVEPQLEVDEDQRGYFYHYRGSEEQVQSRLPFVRLFCLETKAYVYADVDDVQPYEFDHSALNRLHLPENMHGILSRVFNTPIEKMFGDLLKGKHGGVVVLASGDPGVGKTLTAEIYAEITERPLYVLELGELGTSASEVEERLQHVFARVTRWNAVLQFDECEIFLSKRDNDLERSAIVGIFLRLLDYYRGLLFLTTNRANVLDDAILSRVMLRLNYPKLNSDTRTKVWRTMFDVARMRLEGISFQELGTLNVNGRQIRNLTRLAKIICPECVVTRTEMEDVLRFGCGEQLPTHSA